MTLHRESGWHRVGTLFSFPEKQAHWTHSLFSTSNGSFFCCLLSISTERHGMAMEAGSKLQTLFTCHVPDPLRELGEIAGKHGPAPRSTRWRWAPNTPTDQCLKRPVGKGGVRRGQLLGQGDPGAEASGPLG